jgi:hypothetical protein
MGLDTYAVNSIGGPLNDDQKQAFRRKHIRIRSLSVDNNGSNGYFRGKVYANLIKSTTGYSLYQEKIEPEDVEDMLHNLRLAIDDMIELEKFLEVCVEYELALFGDC